MKPADDTIGECCWGVPCLVGPAAVLYSNDHLLKEMLVVDELDSPSFIAHKIKSVLANINQIKKRLPGVVNYMFKRALIRWDKALNHFNTKAHVLLSSSYQEDIRQGKAKALQLKFKSVSIVNTMNLRVRFLLLYL